MSTLLVGRARELAQIDLVLAASLHASVPKVVLIEGESGIGKSALLQGACENARAGGWIAATTSCHSLQSALPFSAVRQISRALRAELGTRESRYIEGLETFFDDRSDAEAAARGLAGLLEGVSLDFPVVLAVDDLQWADSDSLRYIEGMFRKLADRRIAFLHAARRAMTTDLKIAADATVVLEPLRKSEARELFRSMAPDAGEDVAEEVLRHARGYPLDVIALAEAVVSDGIASAEDVAISRGALVARRVRKAEPAVREFLQICSLLEGSIPYRLLELLWPDGPALDSLLQKTLDHYLISGDGGVGFTHPLVATSIRETIALPTPYRRQIIAALERLEDRSPEDHQRLAEQLAACGNRLQAFKVLSGLIAGASGRGDRRLVVNASKRALELGEPPTEFALPFFMTYADALHALSRDSELEAVLERTQAVADVAGSVPGRLVARIILFHCWNGQLERARATFARYIDRVADPIERTHVYSAALWFDVCDLPYEAPVNLEHALAELDETSPATVRLRTRHFKSFVRALRGNHKEALQLLSEIDAIPRDSEVAVFEDKMSEPVLFVNLFEYGTSALESFLSSRRATGEDSDTIDEVAYYRTLNYYLTEDWNRAEMSIAAAYDRVSSLGRRRLLVLSAAISVLRNRPSEYHDAIEEAARAFMHGRAHGLSGNIAAWWAAMVANTDPQSARTVVERLLHRTPHRWNLKIDDPAIALVLAAKRLGDETTLKLLAAPNPKTPKTPWHRAHERFATALARTFLRETVDCRELVAECTRLGLPLFADLATAVVKPASEASARLGAIGVTWQSSERAAVLDPGTSPTARELQIAEQVSLGKTNRTIASDLVLSQRTIEAHLANLFNKLGVSSRTQLANWYLKHYPSSA